MQSKTLLIKNGKIETMSAQGCVEGDILIQDGKIVQVGGNLSGRFDDVQVIDAEGHYITPGLVEAHSHVGMWESSIGFEGEDSNEAIAPNTAWVRGIDGFNPNDIAVHEALAMGVITVATGPGSANVLGGSFVALKLYGDCVDDMIIQDPIAMKCAFGENPKRVYNYQKKMPTTRMGTAAVLREALVQAQSYMQKHEQAAAEGKPAPDRDLKHEALVPVLRGEIPLKAHVHRADDIFTAIRIAKEFGIRITLDHCTEGHLIADRVAACGFPAIVGPSFGHRSKFELKEKSFTTAGILARAGVKVAITTDANVLPQSSLPLMAAMAVSEGLDAHEGLRAITINPAEILGLDARIGSLEAGKDADVVIWNTHPFAIDGKPLYVIVDGCLVAGTKLS